jgi:hypothetical protein
MVNQAIVLQTKPVTENQIWKTTAVLNDYLHTIYNEMTSIEATTSSL